MQNSLFIFSFAAHMLFPYTTELANSCHTEGGRQLWFTVEPTATERILFVLQFSVAWHAVIVHKDWYLLSCALINVTFAWQASWVTNVPDTSHFTVCTPEWGREPDSWFHISYRNAQDSLFHLDEHIDYLNCFLKWQVTENTLQSLDNCHCW